MLRLIEAETLLKELTCNFAGEPFHGNKKITIGEIRRIVDSIPTSKCAMTSVKQAIPPSEVVVMAYDFRGVLYLECCYSESMNGWYDVRRHKPICYRITYWMNYPDYPKI